MGSDNSRYGLINAVTRASQDLEDYTRATELKRLGGELLALPSMNKEVKMPEQEFSSSKTVKVIPLGIAR